ncbi:hypothetical protein H4R20_006686, partial [Coemansia guatemalensis]
MGRAKATRGEIADQRERHCPAQTARAIRPKRSGMGALGRHNNRRRRVRFNRGKRKQLAGGFERSAQQRRAGEAFGQEGAYSAGCEGIVRLARAANGSARLRPNPLWAAGGKAFFS